MNFKWIIKMQELTKLKIDTYREVLLKMWNRAFKITQNKVYQLCI